MSSSSLRSWLFGFITLSIMLSGGRVFARQVDDEGIGIVTGSSTGTYIQFGRDMAQVAAKEGLKLLVKNSEGSLANINRLVSRENAAVGIVQSDVLGFLTRSDDPKLQQVARRLRLIFPFYDEEVHLLAQQNIERIEDLEGKRVVLGTKGSGNWLTANNLLHLMGIEPSERLHLDPAAAATAVFTGKADAMFFVGGKPVKLFSNIANLDQNPAYAGLLDKVHFVPIDDPKLLKEYSTAVLSPDDYSWIEQDTPTLAIKAVLVGFDFTYKNTPYYKLRCEQLRTLGKAVRNNMEDLKNTGHPKWRQVNLDEDVGIWKRDGCANAAPRANSTTDGDYLFKGLSDCIRTGSCR